MSEAKHTAGPWRVLEWADNNKGFIAIVGPGDPTHICDVFPFGRRAEGQSLSEHKANARLIAAAPTMLAALQAMLAIHTTGLSVADQIKAVEDAKAAIARAEGHPPPVTPREDQA